MKKRILYFIPDNPFYEKSGNRTRYLHLLDYLNSLSSLYETEVLSIGDWGIWEDVHKNEFADRYPQMKLHIFNRKGSKTNLIKKFFEYKLPTAIPKLFRGTTIDVTNFILRNKVKKLVKQEDYNMVIASYASWGRLFDGINPHITKIIDTHDFLTAQLCHKRSKIGKLFQSEMKILKNYDIIWTFSTEEAYIFEQFTDSKVIYIPTSNRPLCSQSPNGDILDVLYVASSNKHNVKSAKWLRDKVLPYLSNTKIHIVGEICKYIDDHPKIVKHGVVEDLSTYYQRSRVAICPMLSGTGVKIKVIEALSYALPIVTTKRGVDGLVNKTNNGCIITHSAKTFADRITRLIYDEDYYQQHRLEAESYYQQCHAPSLEKEVLDDIFLGQKTKSAEETTMVNPL